MSQLPKYLIQDELWRFFTMPRFGCPFFYLTAFFRLGTLLRESKPEEVCVIKPGRYLGTLKADVALSARQYGVPAGEGHRVHSQHALTKERQEIWCRSSEGSANFPL